MHGKWGEDITRILNVSQETNAAVDKRLSLLSKQSNSEYTRLQDRITETAKQQTVLMTAIESMEDQLAQVPTVAEGICRSMLTRASSPPQYAVWGGC